MQDVGPPSSADGESSPNQPQKKCNLPIPHIYSSHSLEYPSEPNSVIQKKEAAYSNKHQNKGYLTQCNNIGDYDSYRKSVW
jgi:hypothetical protein